MRSILALLVLVASSVPAFAQSSVPISTFVKQNEAVFLPVTRTVDLSGPRFGFTQLTPRIVDKLKERNIEVTETISQFGWQFEKQFNPNQGGPTLVTEWVLLAGGVEQGVFLPSVSWLVGVRTKSGMEFGIGPNLSVAGSALVASAGMTLQAGGLNIPVNIAVVPSVVNWETYGGPPSFRVTEIEKRALRVSLLFGFNTRR